MLREPKKKGSKKKITRFPGIVQAARDLGVSRIHLWYVLTGERLSPALIARYNALPATIATKSVKKARRARGAK